MDNKHFSDEIDELVESGQTELDEYGLGIESFHHLRHIRKRLTFLTRLNYVLIFFSLVLLIGFFIAIMGNDDEKKGLPDYKGNGSTAVVDTIEKLRSENIQLKERNSSLQNEIKLLRKQFIARGGAESELDKTDNQTTSAQEEDFFYYEARRGETVYTIAEKFYGDRAAYKKIMNDNGLFRESDIHEGKQLKIYSSRKKR